MNAPTDLPPTFEATRRLPIRHLKVDLAGDRTLCHP